MINKTIDLSQYKAPGVYFVEFDASEYTQVNSTTLRLVAGFSKKGVYNRPVLIQNKDQALDIYGDIDTTLEMRGSFFHRSLFTCLEAGPVLALALLPVNNGQDVNSPRDTVEYASFSLDMTEQNAKIGKSLYSAFFNKERFWDLDVDNFDKIIKGNATANGKLFSIANLGQKKISTIVRKASVQGFNLTAQEFYGSTDIPVYLQPFDIMNDFFIEVIAIEGEWDDYAKLSNHPTYSKYFNKEGLIKDKLNNFLSDETVKFIGSWIGSVIPDLVDGNGRNWSIDTSINQGMSISGLFASLNRTVFDNYQTKLSTDSDLDMTGYKLLRAFVDNGDDTTGLGDVSLLSYTYPMEVNRDYISYNNSNVLTNSFSVTDDLVTYEMSSVYKGSTTSGILNNVLVFEKPLATDYDEMVEYNSLVTNLTPDALLIGSDFTTNVITETYFTIADAYEKVTYDENTNQNTTNFYVEVKTPNKKMEVNLEYSIAMANVTTGVISIPAYTGSLNDTNHSFDVYFKNTNDSSKNFYTKISYFVDDAGTFKLQPSETIMRTKLSTIYNEEGFTNWRIIIPNLLPFLHEGSGQQGIKYSNAPNYIEALESNYYYAYPGSKMYKDIQNGIVTSGMSFVYDEDDETYYIKVEDAETSFGYKVKKFGYYTSSTLTPSSNDSVFNAANYTYTLLTGKSELIKNISIMDVINPKTIKISGDYFSIIDYKIGDYVSTQVIVDDVPQLYLTKIVTITNVPGGDYLITADEEIFLNGSSQVYIVKNIDRTAPTLKIFKTTGLKLGEYHLPGTFLNRQSQLAKILGVMAPGTNIYKSLMDNENLRFRYIVDTFSGGLSAEAFPKNYLTRLARDKQRTLAIMNAPSIKEFKESNDPLFSDLPSEVDPSPPIRVDYIRDGGNLSLGPSVRFSLPSEENGSKFSGFFISYPMVRSNRKTIAVPPAAGISNRFVSKHTDGSKYNPVAGKYGSFSVTGAVGTLEYDFTQEERGYLAEVGLNPIVWKQNSGYTIFDDLMAYQKTRSAFNNLSLRDLLITIEDGIDGILGGYLFDNNVQIVRDEITARVSSFLTQVKSGGGLVDFTVTMNEVNNTSETISAGFGILDVEIEPAFPIKKFVTKITVHKSGGLSQTGFNG